MPWTEVGTTAEEWAEILDWLIAGGDWDDYGAWDDDALWLDELWSEQ
jgi:hypothetical protein